MRLLYILTLFFALPSSPSQKEMVQDDFCNTLNQIMQSSKEDFKPIRTQEITEIKDFFGNVSVCKSNIGFQNAESSTVNKGMKTYYQAILLSNANNSDNLHNLFNSTKNQLETCLGSKYKFTQIEDKLNDLLTVKAQVNTGNQSDLYEPVIKLKYGKLDTKFAVVLEVEEPFFKRK